MENFFLISEVLDRMEIHSLVLFGGICRKNMWRTEEKAVGRGAQVGKILTKWHPATVCWIIV